MNNKIYIDLIVKKNDTIYSKSFLNIILNDITNYALATISIKYKYKNKEYRIG